MEEVKDEEPELKKNASQAFIGQGRKRTGTLQVKKQATEGTSSRGASASASSKGLNESVEEPGNKFLSDPKEK